jgi:hypothetical protein
VVPLVSHGVSRAPCYSGTPLNAYLCFRLRGFHPLWPNFPDRLASTFSAQGALNPRTNPGLGCSDFARRYLRNKCLSLFLQVLRCFSSLRSLLQTMNSFADTLAGGFPHSEISGSKSGCRLAGAYRRLPRLSSPLDAKASTTHP